MGDRVFSPKAPEQEMAGAQAAERYYKMMSRYGPKEVIESAERLRGYLVRIAGYSFYEGFLAWAGIIAQSRLGRG